MSRIDKTLDSSAIRRVQWDDASGEMILTFASGRAYSYPDTPIRLARGLIRAKSAGRYFNKRIRPLFFVSSEFLK